MICPTHGFSIPCPKCNAKQAHRQAQREVTNSCPICNARGLTVREAFAKAGHPVDKCSVRCGHGTPDPIWWAAYGSLRFVLVGGQWRKGSVHVWDGLLPIDLANLPAQDAYDALPQVVRDAIASAGGEGS